MGLTHTAPRRDMGWTTRTWRMVGSTNRKNGPRSDQHGPRYANHRAPRPRKLHQQEHRPQRPTERSDPTQHAKGRTGDCPGPRTRNPTGCHTVGGGTGGGWKRRPAGGGGLCPALREVPATGVATGP